MRAILPFLITGLLGLGLCIGCTHTNSSKALQLERELTATPPLSPIFDSLLLEARTLPAAQRVSVLFHCALRDEKELETATLKEALLLEALPLANKQKRKQILLHLAEFYNRQIYYERIPNAQAKGSERCAELERDYPLSQEERWRVMEMKAVLLTEIGQQALYMPILFQLLEEHRQAERPAFILNDLILIGNSLAQLGDAENALEAFQEAYELSIDHQLPKQQERCLRNIISLASHLGRGAEILRYHRLLGTDTMAWLVPNAYKTLAESYVQVGKPDSARIYFQKELQAFPHPYYAPIPYCLIAQTFTSEQNEDSAAAYLNKAMELQQQRATRTRKKNLKSSLPDIFLEVYPSFATLLQQNGKMREAGEAFALIEPLTKSPQELPIAQKIQIDALVRYAAYCQATRQYEKGFGLMLRCDSLRKAYNENRERRTDSSITERFKVQELTYTIDLQKVQLAYSQRILVTIGCAALVLLCSIMALIYLYRQRQRQFALLFTKNREIEQLRDAADLTTSSNERQADPETPVNPIEDLFRAAEEKVTSGQLFLHKELSMEQLAQELNTNRSYLSSCINTCSGGNFNQWINSYRIGYVLDRIHATSDLTQLAAEAGFLSIDSFYRHFKRCTQMTTSQYLKTIE